MEFFSIEQELQYQEFSKLCPTILIIENEDGIRNALEETFSILGCKYYSAKNWKEGIDLYQQNRMFDLVILDIRQPVTNGRSAFNQIRDLNPKQKILMTGGHRELQDLDDLKEGDFQGFIKKPFNIYTIIGNVKNLVFN
jgi:DNA-binding NtrC family response regulator